MTDPIDALRALGELPASPAFARNREPILSALRPLVPREARVLEIGSGTSEHARWLAPRLSVARWQISDRAERLAYLEAWHQAHPVEAVQPPIVLDLSSTTPPPSPGTWNLVLAINVIHISPAACTASLLRLASEALAPGGRCALYGPYFEDGVEPAASNLAFDASLKAQDPSWGVRSLELVDRHAAEAGLVRLERHEVPANNLVVVYGRPDEAPAVKQGSP